MKFKYQDKECDVEVFSNEDGIMSALLKKDFFDNSSTIDYSIDSIEQLLPNMDEAFISYNLEGMIT